MAFHFAGLFVWAGVAAAVLLTALRAGGVRLAVRRAPALVLPALLNLPMYIGASKAPEHIGSKALQMSRVASLPGALARYVMEILPSLTGGHWAGVALLLAGCLWLVRRGKVHRRLLSLTAAMIFSILLFLAYSHLRDYMPNVARYWVYALAPALTLVAVGLHGLLGAEARPRPWRRNVGWLVAVTVLAGNAVATGALLSVEGRLYPFKRFQHHLETLPKARKVVSANHYENRFLGGYYPIPAGGQALAPCLWEEGRAARVRGLKAIWTLVPDAVAYVVDAHYAEEFREAGALRPGCVGFQPEWSRLLRWAWRIGVYPEPHHNPPVAPGLFHRARATLAAEADEAARPVVVPGAGWPLVPFRDLQGAVQFALLAPEEAAPVSLDLYLPPALAAAGSVWQLDLVAAAYRSTRLEVSVGGRRVEGPSPRIARTPARSQYLPQRQTFEGLPKPGHLQAAGMQFVVVLRPDTLHVPLGALPAGWTTVEVSSVQSAPWMLLSHACTPVAPSSSSSSRGAVDVLTMTLGCERGVRVDGSADFQSGDTL